MSFETWIGANANLPAFTLRSDSCIFTSLKGAAYYLVAKKKLAIQLVGH